MKKRTLKSIGIILGFAFALALICSSCKKERECYCSISTEQRDPNGNFVTSSKIERHTSYKGKKNECKDYSFIDNVINSRDSVIYSVKTEATCELR